MNLIKTLLAIGCGSAVGGICRYLLTQLLSRQELKLLPWGTFAVNILGCFLIGIIFGLIDRGMTISPAMKAFLTVGFCGGFTTFSTFINENFMMLGTGQALCAIAYIVLSLAVGLFAVWGGHSLTTQL